MTRKGHMDVYSDSDDEVDVCEFEQNLSEEEDIFMCSDDGRDAESDHSKVSFSRVFFCIDHSSGLHPLSSVQVDPIPCIQYPFVPRCFSWCKFLILFNCLILFLNKWWFKRLYFWVQEV